jgi:ribosomal protein L37AE/L43A
MSTTAVEYGLMELLERAGCKLRGRNRVDCPRCGGRRTVSFTDELYCCHHAGCDFSGNAFTLARELGLARRLSPTEARALRLERERAEAAATAFLLRVRGARFGLGGLHIELLNLRDEAHERLKVNHDDETAWDALAYVYSELPRVRADLALLSEGTIGDRIAWLEADHEKRREMADRILQVGGVPTFDGKWVEVSSGK